ncbi:MAG: hypothetical protein AAGC60_24755 [Acidobacteriota bacterium]
MNNEYLLSSLTRIAPLDSADFRVSPLARTRWSTGQYVVGRVLRRPGALRGLELRSGRMAEVGQGDLVIGALGERAATLEIVGSWRAVGDDLELNALTAAGLLGKVTSRSYLLAPTMSLRYVGHVWLGEAPAAMDDFVPPAPADPPPLPKVLLIIGSSMSAGKTTVGRIVIRHLRQAGITVAAAKITGAGRYRDSLSFHDAGARPVLDFVDVGLPSTICPADEFRPRLRALLGRLAEARPRLLVLEAGASPLEPYNGEIAIEELGDRVRFTILCASDPYAVSGLAKSFGRRPDLVTGPATSTRAGADLIEKLSDVPAADLLDPEQRPAAWEHLGAAFGLAL